MNWQPITALLSPGFIFYVLCLVILLCAFSAVTRKNLLHAALSLMGVLIGVAGLYVLLSADFLAAVQVILYVGGILVLIIFAVMLTENMTHTKIQVVNEQKGAALIVMLILLIVLISVLTGNTYRIHSTRHSVAEVAPEIQVKIDEQAGALRVNITDQLADIPPATPLNEGRQGTTARIGVALMTDHVLPFEVASLLLLAAMVGAILFTRREVPKDKGKER